MSGVSFLKVSFSHINHSAFLILTQNMPGMCIAEKIVTAVHCLIALRRYEVCFLQGH